MKRFLSLMVIISVAIGIVAVGHWYIADRLFLRTELSGDIKTSLMLLLTVLGLGMVAQPILERSLPRRFTVLLNWPAYIWMGIAFILVCTIGLFDVVEFVTFNVFGIDLFQSDNNRSKIIFLLVFCLSSIGLFQGLSFPKTKTIKIYIDKWPTSRAGYRIVQITDIHVGPLFGKAFARKLTQACNGLRPDLIAVTGDAIDGTVAKIGTEVEPFSKLQANDGVFYVTGNHEHYYHPGDWCQKFSDLGLEVLRNSRRAIGQGKSSFLIAGCYDFRGAIDECKEDQHAALGGRTDSLPLIFLAHDPSSFSGAIKYGVDLQLSGHTHGGQIWPFCYLVRLAIKYVAGHYREGGSQLYVSRGTGFWGPPMRLFAPQEVTLIELYPSQHKAQE